MSSQGYRNSEDQKNLRRWMDRKFGVGDSVRATVGQEEMQYQWMQYMHTLPQGAPVEIQNTDGSFPYLPGLDGPVS